MGSKILAWWKNNLNTKKVNKNALRERENNLNVKKSGDKFAWMVVGGFLMWQRIIIKFLSIIILLLLLPSYLIWLCVSNGTRWIFSACRWLLLTTTTLNRHWVYVSGKNNISPSLFIRILQMAQQLTHISSAWTHERICDSARRGSERDLVT